MLKRLLIAVLGLAAVALMCPRPAAAQAGGLASLQQTVTIHYGDEINFDAHASAGTVLTGARLTVRVAGRSDAHSLAVPVDSPGTSISLSQTVPVTTLGLPPFADITYQWDFQDAGGSEFQGDPQQLWYQDTSVPFTWSEAMRGNVLVYTDGRDPLVASEALDVAAGALAEIRRTLGTAPDDTIRIYVYPELAQLASSLRLHGLRVQDWVAAYAVPDQLVAMVSAAPGVEFSASLKRDLPHELMHLAVAVAVGTGSVPAWFNEGMAVTSEAEPDPTLASTLDTAARDGALIPLDQLCVSNFSGFTPRDAALAYAESASVMRYVQNRYGSSQIRALAGAFSDGLDCDGAVQRGLGLSLTALEGQWHNDLLRVAAEAPRDNTSLLPWVAVWVISLGLALLFIAPQPHGAAGGRDTERHDPPSAVLDETTG